MVLQLLFYPLMMGSMMMNNVVLIVLAYLIYYAAAIGAGIIIAVIFSIVFALVALEGRDFFSSLGRALHMFRAGVWRLSGAYCLLWVFSVLMTGVPLLTAIGFMALPAFEGGVVALIVALCAGLVAGLLTVAVYPLRHLFGVVAYFDARVRLEALDLQLLAGAIAHKRSPGWSSGRRETPTGPAHGLVERATQVPLEGPVAPEANQPRLVPESPDAGGGGEDDRAPDQY
jgi:hypothetical protein